MGTRRACIINEDLDGILREVDDYRVDSDKIIVIKGIGSCTARVSSIRQFPVERSLHA